MNTRCPGKPSLLKAVLTRAAKHPARDAWTALGRHFAPRARFHPAEVAASTPPDWAGKRQTPAGGRALGAGAGRGLSQPARGTRAGARSAPGLYLFLEHIDQNRAERRC
jgi:hypothetical protein